MILKSVKKGVEKEFSDEHARKILSMPNNGYEYVGETPAIPIHDLSLIDGITKAMITKLKKKGIVNYYQLFTCCETTQKQIGITPEMIAQAEELIRLIEMDN